MPLSLPNAHGRQGELTSFDSTDEFLFSKEGSLYRIKTSNFTGFLGTMNGAVGDGSTDDIVALQATIDEAEIQASSGAATGLVMIDLQGKTYAVSDTLTIDDSFVGMKNGGLKAIGTWSTDKPILHLDGASRSILEDLFINCDHLSQGILIDGGSSRGAFENVLVKRGKTFQIKASSVVQEYLFDHCIVRQFDFGETGYNVTASRTADGFLVATADSFFRNCVANYCRYPLKLEGNSNLFSDMHLYNGGGVDGTDAVNIYATNDGVNMFTNLYNDSGIILLEDAFENVFIGLKAWRSSNSNTTTVIRTLTSTASTTLNGMVVQGGGTTITGGSFTNGFLDKTTTGSGSYTTPTKQHWLGFAGGEAHSSIPAQTLNFTDLPTSDPTSAGQLWNNSGVLTVSAG